MIIGDIFNLVLFQPLFNLLILLYSSIALHTMGLAIVFLTIFIKLVLYPLSVKALKAQKALADVNPKITQLRAKYKDDKEGLARAMVALYRDEKINPFSSLGLLVVQIPFLIAVYMALTHGLGKADFSALYPFVTRPSTLNYNFLGLFDLQHKSIYLALLAGASQFWQAKMLPTQPPAVHTKGSKDEELAAVMNKQMLYFAPVLTLFVAATLPSGLALYWTVSNLLTVLQQFILFRNHPKKNEKNADASA